MRPGVFSSFLLAAILGSAAFAQCAPAPDSSYFFRDLAEKRAAAKIADNRAFYDGLLSATFPNKQAFIDGELAAGHASGDKPPFAVRDFKLLEHRKGFVVASYVLSEGVVESRQREVYQVEDGQWRLTIVERQDAQR